MKIYISCPVSVEYIKVIKVANTLRDLGCSVGYWKRSSGTYIDTPLREADAVVFMLPDNKFDAKISELTSDIVSEYRLARALNKTVYLTYFSKAKEKWQFYQTDNQLKNTIQGVSGTYPSVLEQIDKAIKKSKEPTEDTGCNSYEGKIEYKSLPLLEEELKKSLDYPLLFSQCFNKADYADPYGMTWQHIKASHGDTRVFSERMLSSQLYRVRRLLLL